MRLLDRLVRRDAGYWEGQASGAAVLTSSYGSPDREAVLPQLAGWAQQVNASDSPVFSAILVRMMLLAEAQFQFQAKDDKHLFGNQTLAALERPFGPGSTSGELIARMEQDASLAGNAYIWSTPDADAPLVRLRPDWVTIVSELVSVPGGGSYRQKVGYWHQPPQGVTGHGAPFMAPADEVAHWHPIPDPAADFRGMSWLTPVMRDVTADDAMTRYKIRYLSNNATPNIIIKYAQKLQPATIDAIRDRMTARYGGPDNAGKTLVLDQGADLTLAGNSLSQMDFSNVSVDGVQRILAPSGVPALLIGLESIKGAGKSYEDVIRRFADLTLRSLWRSMCAALEELVADVPAGARLWYDTGAIAALQQGEQVRAQVALIHGQALLAYQQAGYDKMSAVAAVQAGDVSLLKPAAAPPPVPTGNVQHMLPQTSPGATADPLPPSTPRLPTGSTSPGDGGNSTRPVPVATAARRALNGAGHA
ncbi:MAG TPA: phage portal protein [Trebonia sp.]|nr:phage portal protein [Trebonia sp.]